MTRMFLKENDVIYPYEIELENDSSNGHVEENNFSLNDPIGSGVVPLLYKRTERKGKRKITRGGESKNTKKRRKRKILVKEFERIQPEEEEIQVIQSKDENLKTEEDTTKEGTKPALRLNCIIGVLSPRKGFIGKDLRLSGNVDSAESFVIEWISKKIFRIRGGGGLYLSQVSSVQSDRKVLGQLEYDEEESENFHFSFRKHTSKIPNGLVSLIFKRDQRYLNPIDLSFTKKEPKEAFRVNLFPTLLHGNSVFIQLQSCNYNRFLVSEQLPHGVSVTCSFQPKNPNRSVEKKTLFRVYSLTERGRKEFFLYTLFGSHIKCDEEGVIEETIEDPNALPSRMELFIVGEDCEVVMKEVNYGYLESRSDAEGRISLGSERVGYWELFRIKFFVGVEIE